MARSVLPPQLRARILGTGVASVPARTHIREFVSDG